VIYKKNRGGRDFGSLHEIVGPIMIDYQSSQAGLLDIQISGHPARQRMGGRRYGYACFSYDRDTAATFPKVHYRLCKKGVGEY
jgi:hypothetical protein